MYFRVLSLGSCFRRLAFFSLLAFFAVGCVHGDGVTRATPDNRTTRGGIRYDSSAPLDARVTPEFNPADPPAQAYTYRVTYKGGEGATVPALLTIPVKRQGKAPAILLLHGLGGRKEDMSILGVALARRGYASLALDIAGHGERPGIHGKPLDRLDRSELRLAIGQTIADLRRGLDFLAQRPEIEANRSGFLGISLGGIIGGVLSADEPRLRGVVLWSAGGDWGKLLTTSQHPWAKAYRRGDNASVIERELQDVDPAAALAESSPQALFLIHGAQDTIVPADCARALYTAVKGVKKRLELTGGHIPDPTTMMNETLLWLETMVKNAPVRPPKMPLPTPSPSRVLATP
ncbi:MAG: alpha/beta hydrolase [bacterium]